MNNTFDFFEKIYCINLPESKDRKNKVSAEFNKVGILDRVQWVYAEKPVSSIKCINELKYPQGEIGTSLSHGKAISKAMYEGSENVLIFEDDVFFKKDLIEIFRNSIDQLPNDWDIFFLGGNPRNKMEKYSKNLLRVGNFLQTHSYAVSRHYMGALLDLVFDNVTKKPMDAMTGHVYTEKNNRFCMYPSMCWAESGHSIIRNANRDYTINVEKNWREFKP
jgi:GR25 family glycosyltransferase involved in LPS biosynthesis